jgi:hypothetical protein
MRRYLLISAGAAAIVLLSGCMVGPKYVKPAAPLAPGFKETTAWKEGDGWKIAKPNDDLLRGKWWELYGDAKLNQSALFPVEPGKQWFRRFHSSLRSLL